MIIMSLIEDILMEAWELGIKDQIMERVHRKQEEQRLNGKWIFREQIYEEAMCEIKAENGSRD